MTKQKEPKESKKKKVGNPLIEEEVKIDGETKRKITYPDGRVEYKEL